MHERVARRRAERQVPVSTTDASSASAVASSRHVRRVAAGMLDVLFASSRICLIVFDAKGIIGVSTRTRLGALTRGCLAVEERSGGGHLALLGLALVESSPKIVGHPMPCEHVEADGDESSPAR